MISEISENNDCLFHATDLSVDIGKSQQLMQRYMIYLMLYDVTSSTVQAVCRSCDRSQSKAGSTI